MKLDVVCGILVDGDEVMIACRKGKSAGWYEFPGGKVEAGETREEALKREWREECGIDIENIQYLDSSTDVQGEDEIHLTCFTCTSQSRPEHPLVHSEFLWVHPDHIYDHKFFEADRQLVARLQEEWECLAGRKK